uniref:Cytochrome b n=1 Tax=Seladonia aeraria TaxID=1310367 RepID=A0A7T9KR73_9HYME|nr:cytochrome b [Seladonia aeraria]QQS74779.1 cytochrome b [Seladonia aeraria]
MKFSKLFKNNKLLSIFNNSLNKLPTPFNINMWWNFGSILGMFLIIQIISGLFLSMHYCPNINYAFHSTIHIMKNVKFGWWIRLIHMNGASFFFLTMFLHIARGIYYHSFKLINVWLIGVIILIMSMATAFLGYVLPWGQMSFWGATVITNLLSAFPYIGKELVEWIWGGFSINNATLNRFYTFHFVLPFIILFMVVIHLFFLHASGSNNPLGSKNSFYLTYFNPYFLIKDILGYILILFLFIMITLISPYTLSDPDNFIMANPMITPEHIKPEWYFLFAYTILRIIPNKFGGVLGLFSSILILMFMPLINHNKLTSSKFYFLSKIMFWIFILSFIMLTWLGGQLIENPFISLSLLFTLIYFSYFMITPMLNYLWDKLIY